MQVLSWDFFLARFDTLALEAQLYLANKTGDVPIAQGRLDLGKQGHQGRMMHAGGGRGQPAYDLPSLPSCLHLSSFFPITDYQRMLKQKNTNLRHVLMQFVQGSVDRAIFAVECVEFRGAYFQQFLIIIGIFVLRLRPSPNINISYQYNITV